MASEYSDDFEFEAFSPKVMLISPPRFMEDVLASNSPTFASVQFFGAVPFRYAPLSLRKVLMSSTPLTRILRLLMFVVRLAARIFCGSRCFMWLRLLSLAVRFVFILLSVTAVEFVLVIR